MFDLIAQQTQTDAVSGAQLLGYMLAALIVGIGGAGGAGYAWRRVRNGSAAQSQSRDLCPVHDLFEKHLDERHRDIKRALDQIQQGINRIHERLDERT